MRWPPWSSATVKRRPTEAAGKHASASHRVRIVGGRWKRTPLSVPQVAGLRPTPDRVRETLVNWLGQDLSGLRCLDAFAGSGALGLEAASRGAAHVLMIERDRVALAAIRSAIERLGGTQAQVELVSGDALAEMQRRSAVGERFDLVFLDPPFGDEALLVEALRRLPPLLAPGALVYVETAEAWPGSDPPAQFRVARAGRAGAVHYHLLVHEPDAGDVTAAKELQA